MALINISNISFCYGRQRQQCSDFIEQDQPVGDYYTSIGSRVGPVWIASTVVKMNLLEMAAQTVATEESAA